MRASRKAERSATLLGDQPESETYCKLADSPIVVSREGIVLHIVPTRKIDRISTSNLRPQISI